MRGRSGAGRRAVDAGLWPGEASRLRQGRVVARPHEEKKRGWQRSTQDFLVPYILDPRHEEDTLFVVAEADWRLFPDPPDAPVWWTAAAAATERLRRAAAMQQAEAACQAAAAPSPAPGSRGGAQASTGASSSSHAAAHAASASAADAPAAGAASAHGDAAPSPAPGGASSTHAPSPAPGVRTEPSAGPEPKVPSFVGWQAKPPRCPPSPELISLVRACTAAHRLRHGALVWLSWDGTKQAKGTPSHSSAAIVLTRRWARAYKPWIETQKPGHGDVLLRSWLKGGAAHEVGCCWVWPSVGSYCEHVSECEPSLAGASRESSFGKPWVRAGFGGERWLRTWNAQGHVEWLAELKVQELVGPAQHTHVHWHPAPTTQHPAPSTRTQHPAPSTRHPAPSTQHPAPPAPPAPNTRHPARSTQNPAPSTQHPVPNTHHPAPSTI